MTRCGIIQTRRHLTHHRRRRGDNQRRRAGWFFPVAFGQHGQDPGALQVKNLGMETFHVGMLLAAFAVMFIVFQFPAGAYSDRAGRLRPIVLSLGIAIVSLLVLPSLSTFTWLALALAVYGAAYGILFPSISALVVEHTTSQERGLATGAFHALLTAGVAIGAPIMGWIGGLVGVQTGLLLASVTMALALLWTQGAAKHI